MANFSAAFGYSFYIMPLTADNVDVTSVPAAASATAFLPTADVYAANSTVSYSSGVFTIAGNAFNMDGAVDAATPADQPIKLLGLTNAALETDTSSEDIYTYDDETKGFNQSVATTKSFSISLSGVADFADAGYQVLRLTEQNTVADALRVKFVRIGPTGSTEAVFGYGTLTGYTESNEVSSIVSWECTLTGYGAYGLDLQ